ncbi:aspartate aminotransferase family protein [Flavobacterium sp.]|uniref:aspartate aminotransferase family protein n=1 Tax=Flavobacterium sp. TaxID=239 RepID=UPI00286E5A9C|nr:aspartate aminotransferase family protein [Flavobacterium sp.]
MGTHIKKVSEIPGPKSALILARRMAALPAGLGKSTEVVVEKAEGALVWDVDGNQLIDFAGGIGMVNLGHRPEAVVNAIKNQMDKYIHTGALVTTFEPYIEFAEMLNAITPGDFPKKTLLACSGSEAVENAISTAKYFTKRPAIICFEGAYHGRTMLTLSLTSKYGLFKRGFGTFAPDIYRFLSPNLYRKPDSMTDDQYIDYCIERFDQNLISHVDPSAVAAIIIEPVQGEGGFIPVPKRFLEKIRQVCDQHGIVFIADEVQSGAGRTGKFLAIEHSGVIPDIVTMAKSIGSGMPISATTGKAEIMDAPHLGGVGGTYSGSPLAVVAAHETVKQINTPEFLAKATHVGNIITSRLTAMKDKFSIIGDIRGLGAMLVVEFVKDRKTKEPDMDFAMAVIKKCVSNGLILIRAGLYTNCIRFLPPIVITDDQLNEGMDVIEQAVAEVLSERKSLQSINL